jgi:hypothetical protein
MVVTCPLRAVETQGFYNDMRTKIPLLKTKLISDIPHARAPQAAQVSWLRGSDTVCDTDATRRTTRRGPCRKMRQTRHPPIGVSYVACPGRRMAVAGGWS